MKQIILFLLVAVFVLFIYLINGNSNPCEHLKGADYHNQAYHHCYYNYLKGL